MLLICPHSFHVTDIFSLSYQIQVFGSTNLCAYDASTYNSKGPSSATVDQLVGTFSSDPSLIAFAQLCCDPSWNNGQVS